MGCAPVQHLTGAVEVSATRTAAATQVGSRVHWVRRAVRVLGVVVPPQMDQRVEIVDATSGIRYLSQLWPERPMTVRYPVGEERHVRMQDCTCREVRMEARVGH